MKGGNEGFDSDLAAMAVAPVSDTIGLGDDFDDIWPLYEQLSDKIPRA